MTTSIERAVSALVRAAVAEALKNAKGQRTVAEYERLRKARGRLMILIDRAIEEAGNVTSKTQQR